MTETDVVNREAVSAVEYYIRITTHAHTAMRGQVYDHGEIANYHIIFLIYWLFMMNISKIFQHLQIQIMTQSYEAWHTTPS